MSMAPTKLLPDEHKRVFDKVIVPESGIDDLEVTKPPRAIILAGQPGAGKGGLAEMAMRELKENAIIIDTDGYRDAHPEVKEFRKQHPYDWGDDTHPDASAWAKEMLKKATDEGKNFIFDTTLSDGNKAAALIDQLKEKGYQVEVRAIATSSIESELGVDQRFTGSVDRNGFGRFVPEHVRSDIYKALPGSLDTVHEKLPDVPISIYNREKEKVYDSTVDKGTPGNALTEARNQRFLDPDILQAAHGGWTDQQAWHKGFAENWQKNGKLDETTATNLMHERDQHKVVELVDRFAAASQRYLQDVKPDVEPPSKSNASQQLDVPSPQMSGDNTVKPKSI